MNQNQSQLSFRNKERGGSDDVQKNAQLQRFSKQLKDYSRLSEMQKVLSPYWAARSDTVGFPESF